MLELAVFGIKNATINAAVELIILFLVVIWLAVRTSASHCGMSVASMAAASLSSRIEMTATTGRCPAANGSLSASVRAAIPSGLCAPSSSVSGS